MTEEELATIIGRNVRAARLRAGLTQQQLGDGSEMVVPQVSRLEAGTHLPSVKTLKKVADFLKVPICSLLDPDAAPPPEQPLVGRPPKVRTPPPAGPKKKDGAK